MGLTTQGYAVGNVWGMKRPRPLWKKRTQAERRRIFLAEWREFRGMTQEDLADRMGTTKATISRIENRVDPYNQDFLEMAADILGIHHSVLISRGPQPEDVAPIAKAKQRGARR